MGCTTSKAHFIGRGLYYAQSSVKFVKLRIDFIAFCLVLIVNIAFHEKKREGTLVESCSCPETRT